MQAGVERADSEMLKSGMRDSGRTGNRWTFFTETISDQVFSMICSVYSTIHKTLFPGHYFKLIQPIHLQNSFIAFFLFNSWESEW